MYRFTEKLHKILKKNHNYCSAKCRQQLLCNFLSLLLVPVTIHLPQYIYHPSVSPFQTSFQFSPKNIKCFKAIYNYVNKTCCKVTYFAIFAGCRELKFPSCTFCI